LKKFYLCLQEFLSLRRFSRDSRLPREKETGETINTTPLRTKANADLAGHLLLLLQLSLKLAFLLEKKSTFLSKNLSTVLLKLLDTLTTDAMEVGMTGPGTMFMISKDLFCKRNTSTLLSMKPVTMKISKDLRDTELLNMDILTWVTMLILMPSD